MRALGLRIKESFVVEGERCVIKKPRGQQRRGKREGVTRRAETAGKSLPLAVEALAHLGDQEGNVGGDACQGGDGPGLGAHNKDKRLPRDGDLLAIRKRAAHNGGEMQETQGSN